MHVFTFAEPGSCNDGTSRLCKHGCGRVRDSPRVWACLRLFGHRWVESVGRLVRCRLQECIEQLKLLCDDEGRQELADRGGSLGVSTGAKRMRRGYALPPSVRGLGAVR